MLNPGQESTYLISELTSLKPAAVPAVIAAWPLYWRRHNGPGRIIPRSSMLPRGSEATVRTTKWRGETSPALLTPTSQRAPLHLSAFAPHANILEFIAPLAPDRVKATPDTASITALKTPLPWRREVIGARALVGPSLPVHCSKGSAAQGIKWPAYRREDLVLVGPMARARHGGKRAAGLYPPSASTAPVLIFRLLSPAPNFAWLMWCGARLCWFDMQT